MRDARNPSPAPPRAVRPARRRNLSEALLDDPPLDDALPALRTPVAEWSRGDLRLRVGSLAAALCEHGLRRGDPVALVLEDSPHWVAAFLAAVRLGAVVGLAGPGLDPDRLGGALRRLGPRLALTDREDVEAPLGRITGADLAQLAAAGLPDPGPEDTRGDDSCYLLLTSGSTGPPKWAIHRHRDIPACLATYGRHILRLRPGDVTWSVAALPTSYGLGNSLYFPLGAGACAWLDTPATPATAERACRDGGANVLFGVPTFWARLARHVEEGRTNPAAFAAVRLAVSAGERLPEAVWQAVLRTTGMALVDGLGSSEATNLYLSQRPRHPRPGDVGWVVPGFALRVVDERGRPVPDGEVGELWVRGESVMAGYLGDSETTRSTLENGWLRTRDLVRRNPDASYSVIGRVGERFKAGGLWVDPRRVEEEILSAPGVGGAVVLGVEDALGVTRVVAVVARGAEADPEALRRDLAARCRRALAAHEVPRAIAVVDALPTAPSGKVRRLEVREIARAALETAAPNEEVRGGG